MDYLQYFLSIITHKYAPRKHVNVFSTCRQSFAVIKYSFDTDLICVKAYVRPSTK